VHVGEECDPINRSVARRRTLTGPGSMHLWHAITVRVRSGSGYA
jgi:hypothetical protein